MKKHQTGLLAILKSISSNRVLIVALIKREIIGRYRGSVLGLLWSFFNPVFMLAVYTFMFSTVFKARWPGASGSKTEFAMILFAGLIVFNLFSEVVNRSPSLILNNSNYVKKVVFPLEILPFTALGAAIFHFIVSLFAWVVFYIVFFGFPHWTIALIPIVLIPLVMTTIGISWFLSSLGVYLRDVNQFISLVTTALMFLSPVFYPISAVPERLRNLMLANPLTVTIEAARSVLIDGHMPNWNLLVGQALLGLFLIYLGFFWFQATRKGFADVV